MRARPAGSAEPMLQRWQSLLWTSRMPATGKRSSCAASKQTTLQQISCGMCSMARRLMPDAHFASYVLGQLYTFQPWQLSTSTKCCALYLQSRR
jgi:hypothetical protein